MRFYGLSILFLSLNILPFYGQEGKVAKETERDLSLNFKSTSFVRNNEYSNPITEGYTLIGYFIQPELVYHPASKLTLNLGVHLLSYSGTDKFSHVKPVYTATWNFSETTFFKIGSLAGSDSHKMFDPHFKKERLYTDYSEDGIQFMTSGNKFFSDTWVSWEHFIFKGDPYREVFTAGESFLFSSGQTAGIFSFEIPVQLQFKHFGGQISNYNERVETYFNMAAGARLNLRVNKSKSLSAGIESLVFTGSCLTKSAPSGIQQGYALWNKALCNLGNIELEAGYWSSHNYYAPNGNFIFSSVSDHVDNVVIHDRKLLTCSASLKLPYEDILSFYFGFEGYYDTRLKRFDNALMLHLKFDKLIRIIKAG